MKALIFIMLINPIDTKKFTKLITTLNKAGFYETSLKEIERFNFYYPKEKRLTTYLKIKTLYEAKRYYRLYDIGKKLIHKKNSPFNKSILWYYGRSLIKLNLYQEAYILNIKNNHKIFSKRETKALECLLDISKCKKIEKKSKTKALILSTLLPGLGIYYAGDKSLAIKTFFTNIFLFSLTGYFIYKRYYLPAMITGYYGIKFYRYNLINSINKVEEYNYKEERKIKAYFLKQIKF